MKLKWGAQWSWLMAAPAAILVSTAAVAAPASMEIAGQAEQPPGYHAFCRQTPWECEPISGTQRPTELTRSLWALTVETNNAVNTTVEEAPDTDSGAREDLWSYPDETGDCEDRVLEKRRRLMGAGVPAGSLLITLVRRANGASRAVLTFRSHLGEFILDDIEPRILAWSDTEYRFVKRQSENDPGAWVSIADERELPASTAGDAGESCVLE